jgi:hypothetical protein
LKGTAAIQNHLDEGERILPVKFSTFRLKKWSNPHLNGLDMIKLMADNKKTMERLVLVTIIGVTESLLTKAITIDESVRAIFSPYAAEMLNRQKISREIVELVEEGCLLENSESPLPRGHITSS